MLSPSSPPPTIIFTLPSSLYNPPHSPIDSSYSILQVKTNTVHEARVGTVQNICVKPEPVLLWPGDSQLKFAAPPGKIIVTDTRRMLFVISYI